MLRAVGRIPLRRVGDYFCITDRTTVLPLFHVQFSNGCPKADIWLRYNYPIFGTFPLMQSAQCVRGFTRLLRLRCLPQLSRALSSVAQPCPRLREAYVGAQRKSQRLVGLEVVGTSHSRVS